jgi:hypothetical protein
MMFPKPAPRGKRSRDRVDPVLHTEVMWRDGGCVAPIVDSPDACRGRLTLDHVKDHLRMGIRAPSDARHLVTLCEHHHLDGWATSHRPELRTYLRVQA